METQKCQLTIEERSRFLARVYFGNIDFDNLDEIYNATGRRAFSDLARTVVYKNGIQEEVKKLKKENINKKVGDGLKNVEGIKFDEWHNDMCNKIMEIYRPITINFHYGQAQKWVNMMAKYLLTLKYDEFKHLIPFLHIPIDNIVLDIAVKQFGIGKPKEKWSQWNEKTYINYQNTLKGKITEESPILWEYHNWGNYNNTEQIKKKDEPVNSQTPPIYRMKEGHEVLEEEMLNKKGISSVLLLARTKNGSHFCGFWNKDVPNTNIDSVSEIQDIIKELSLSSLKWQNKPEYSRKYVMYTSKDSYNKAKELKDKISKFIHNMNK